MKQIRKRLTYANVMSSIAVFLVIGGATAFAALGKNTVGAKQLKKNAVTSTKIKNEAVTSTKIKKGAVTGAQVNLSSLGTVPSATNASHAATADNATNAGNAEKVNGHSASCPANTTLIRGVCFDSAPNAAVLSVFEASDNCRAKGGFLPSPMELRSTRDVLDLGTGSGTDNRYTDEIYANDAATSYSTVVIADGGGFTAVSTLESEKYVCAYPLVR